MSCEDGADVSHDPSPVEKLDIYASKQRGAANRQIARCGSSLESDLNPEDDRLQLPRNHLSRTQKSIVAQRQGVFEIFSGICK